MLFSKKIIIVAIISILAVAYFLPVFAQTAEKEPPTQCWPQKLCSEKGGNWAQTADSKKNCPANFKGEGLGYCYAKPATVDLQVPIGELKQSVPLNKYIPAIYNYMVSIVSIIAIVMIMVGGLRYLTAGGNPSAVTSAKETILGAVIGLFLTFGSYILLQTINPALVQLKMPDIKMVRSSPLTDTAGECPADSPQKTEKVVFSNCSNDCDCWKGMTCEKVGGATAEITAVYKFLAVAGTAAATGGVVGGGALASGARYIVKGSVTALKALAKTLGPLVLYNPIDTATGIATGAGAYLLVSSLSGPETKSVDNGVCVQLAKASIPAGGLCAFNSNCISGKCFDIYTHQELAEEKLGSIGSCAGDQKAFTGELQCTSNNTCWTNAGPTQDVACVGGYCSWGNEGNTCCIEGAKVPYDQPISTKDSGVVCKNLDGCTIGNVACIGVGTRACGSGLSCKFTYNGTQYNINGDFTDADNFGVLDALNNALFKTGGRCGK